MNPRAAAGSRTWGWAEAELIWGRSPTTPDCLVRRGAPGAAGQAAGGPAVFGQKFRAAPGGARRRPGPRSRRARAGPLRSAASCPAPLRAPPAAVAGRARAEATPATPLPALLVEAGRFLGVLKNRGGGSSGARAQPRLPFPSRYPR